MRLIRTLARTRASGNDPDARRELESRCRALVGEVLTDVTYVEIAYDGGRPNWDGDPRFDSLDYGAELALRSGGVAGFTWSAEIEAFGMTVVEGQITTTRSPDVALWGVAHHRGWAPLLGRTIVGCRVVWREDTGLDGVLYHLPQTILLDFDDGTRVVFTAAELDRRAPWECGADHVTIVFDTELDGLADVFETIHPSLSERQQLVEGLPVR